MYNSFKNGEKVNTIAQINVQYCKDEIGRGHILAKGELTQENVDTAYEDLRGAIYRQETDALYFKSVRGEGTEAEWLAAVSQVKADYPTPTI